MSNDTITLDTNASVAGRYKLVAHRIDEAGNQVYRELTPWFDNLITNQGLNFIGNTSTVSEFLRRCDVGSGNTAPNVNDTSLVSLIGTTTTIQAQEAGASSSAPYYRFCRLTFRFSAGSATGTLAEVGVGPPFINGLVSRSLIKDSAGNPTTVTVLSDETLDVIYEYRVYPDMTERMYNFTTRGGTVYTLTLRPYAVTTGPGNTAYMYTTSRYTSALGSGNSSQPTALASTADQPNAFNRISGFIGANSMGTLDPYVQGNFYREGTATFDLNDANGSPIKTIIPDEFGPVSYSVGISPAVTKLPSERISIKTRLTWSRYVS